MIHGQGEQEWMKESFEKYRQLGLEWKYRYSDDDQETYGINIPQADGRHYSVKNRIKQSPYPQGPKVYPKYVNYRYHPRVA